LTVETFTLATAEARALGIVVSDDKTLLTVSEWTREAAMLTQDQYLIRVAKDYYDSLSCCTRMHGGKKREKGAIHEK